MFEPPVSRARGDPSRQLKPITLKARQECSDRAKHDTRITPLSFGFFCLGASSFNGSRDLTNHPPVVRKFGGVMAGTRETSRFGGGPMVESFRVLQEDQEAIPQNCAKKKSTSTFADLRDQVYLTSSSVTTHSWSQKADWKHARSQSAGRLRLNFLHTTCIGSKQCS